MSQHLRRASFYTYLRYTVHLMSRDYTFLEHSIRSLSFRQQASFIASLTNSASDLGPAGPHH